MSQSHFKLRAFVLIALHRLINETGAAGLVDLLNNRFDKSLVLSQLPFQPAVEPLLLPFSQSTLRS
jgi:hypothetical protein